MKNAKSLGLLKRFGLGFDKKIHRRIKVKKLLLAAIVTSTSACTPAMMEPPKVWFANKEKDAFTDTTTCEATFGSDYRNGGVYTYTGNLYLFVSKVGGQLRVGVKSGGKYKVPVGNIQIRIDKNPAVSIASGETPLNQDQLDQSMHMDLSGMTEEQKKTFNNTYNNMTKSISKSMSPYTATTGEKAQSLLAQMKTGERAIFRVVSMNNTSAQTGSVPLDESFHQALKDCEIE